MIMVLIPAVRAFPQLLVEPKEALVGDQALLGVVGKRELPQLRALGEGFHEAVANERDERNINALKHLFVGVNKFDQRSLAEIHASGHFEPSQSCAALVWFPCSGARGKRSLRRLQELRRRMVSRLHPWLMLLMAASVSSSQPERSSQQRLGQCLATWPIAPSWMWMHSCRKR